MIYVIILFSILLFVLLCKKNNNFEHFSTFTQTQKWSNNLLNIANNINNERKDIADKILKLDIQPEFNVETEIEELLNLQKFRTLEDEKHILNQIELNGLISYFNINDQDRNMILKLTNYIQPITYYLKKHFNRIRPSYYDKRIKPCTSVPLHPSYPSGHGMTSYIIGYYLSHKYPDSKELIMNKACRIAKNREIAGVHYRSDTIYAMNISKVIFDYLKDNNKLQKI